MGRSIVRSGTCHLQVKDRSRYNSFRADGANGQYILVIPEKNAVVVTTANIQDMQSELNLIWKHIYPAL